MRAVAAVATDAAGLRRGIETVLAPALQAWGICAEHSDSPAGGPLVHLRGRAQAIYELIVLAYEPPGALAHAGGVERARCRLVRVLEAAWHRPGSAEPRPVVGIGLDGQCIFVSVQSPGGAGRSDGVAVPWSTASSRCHQEVE